jgi:hypothetical protein
MMSAFETKTFSFLGNGLLFELHWLIQVVKQSRTYTILCKKYRISSFPIIFKFYQKLFKNRLFTKKFKAETHGSRRGIDSKNVYKIHEAVFEISIIHISGHNYN